MLGVVYLAAVVLPVLALLGAVVVRVAGALAREPEGEAALVLELRRPAPAEEPELELPTLPIGFAYDAVAPGPLQLVDDEGPSTKVCPDCAETVLHSARVCRHCQFRFAPPLSGSRAV